MSVILISIRLNFDYKYELTEMIKYWPFQIFHRVTLMIYCSIGIKKSTKKKGAIRGNQGGINCMICLQRYETKVPIKQ